MQKDHIVKKGQFIHRPSGGWTKETQKFLSFLHDKGFESVPKPVGFDKLGREIVSFIKGKVSNYPLSSNAKSIKALISAAKLLRNYHDASVGFLNTPQIKKKFWQMPCREPIEVMCHGDYAPYNIVLNGKEAVGIIDFDTVHPGTRSWDIAYALYRWSPLTNPKNRDGFGNLESQVVRAALFCNSYNLPAEKRIGMANLVIERLQSLINFMYMEADKDNEAMKANIEAGHHLSYMKDIKYIKSHTSYINYKLSEHQ